MANSKKSSKAKRIGHPSHIGSSQSKLEGPIRTRSGKVVYYDPGEGAYYDRSTDLYLSEEETKRLHLNPAPEVAALGAGLGGYLAGPLGAGLGAYLGAKTAETEETKALEKHLKKMGKEKVDAVLDKLGVERNPLMQGLVHGRKKNSAKRNPRREERPRPLVDRPVFDEVETRNGVAFSSVAGLKRYLRRMYDPSGKTKKVTLRLSPDGGWDDHGGLLRITPFDVLLEGGPASSILSKGPVSSIFRFDYYTHIEDKKPFKTEFLASK